MGRHRGRAVRHHARFAGGVLTSCLETIGGRRAKNATSIRYVPYVSVVREAISDLTTLGIGIRCRVERITSSTLSDPLN